MEPVTSSTRIFSFLHNTNYYLAVAPLWSVMLRVIIRLHLSGRIKNKQVIDRSDRAKI